MQSKKETLTEVIVNLIVGYVFSVVITYYVVKPLLHLGYSMEQSFLMVTIFTVASFLRMYFIRRFFNNKDSYIHTIVRYVHTLFAKKRPSVFLKPIKPHYIKDEYDSLWYNHAQMHSIMYERGKQWRN